MVAGDKEANWLEVIAVDAEADRGGRGGQRYCAAEDDRRGGRPAGKFVFLADETFANEKNPPPMKH